MNFKFACTREASTSRLLALLLGVTVLLSACKPDGFINSVKYRGEKHTNTCESFTQDVNKVIQSNSTPNQLQISKYDNSDFSYYYLEPGQFEIKDDSLLFRLDEDFNYPTYLDKGVAVHVNASYKAAGRIADLEGTPEGTIGTLIVDRAYFLKNRKPFFLYKFPLAGAELAGKQLYLSFSIAKYNKKGELKSFFCSTDATPLGTAAPTCCTSIPWENTDLQSVVDYPEIKVQDEEYFYEGFTGTLDVSFDENSFEVDDSLFTTTLLQNYISQFKVTNYRVSRIDLKGFASPGGKESLNLKLSEDRANAVKEGLKVLNGELEGLEITATGMGEDWDRVKQLTQLSSLTAEEKDQVLAIVNSDIENDAKEAELRKVPFWETLVEEVLIKARHTFALLEFSYAGEGVTLSRYNKWLPLASAELKTVANTVMQVKAHDGSASTAETLATLNQVLTKKATPNLYAMRATYHLADKAYDKAIADLETASQVRGGNSAYNLAAQGYKVVFADTYSFEERKALYESVTAQIKQNPGDRPLFFNRAILMDKIGLLSAALVEYDALLEGNTPTAENMNNRGVARLRANMIMEAQSDFEAAIALKQDQAAPYFNLAIIAAYKGWTRKSVEYLDQAIAIDPDLKAGIFNNPAFASVSEDPRFEKYRD